MFLSVITAALRVVGRHNYPSWPTQFRGPATPLAKTGTGPRTINVSTSTERRRRRNLSFLPAERPGPVGRRAAAVISRHGSRRSERATDRQHMLMCPQSVGRSAQRRATDRQRQCPQNINLSDPLMTISDRYYSSRQSPSVGRRSELATAPAKVDCTYALKPLTSLVVWTSVTRSTTADPKAV